MLSFADSIFYILVASGQSVWACLGKSNIYNVVYVMAIFLKFIVDNGFLLNSDILVILVTSELISLKSFAYGRIQ